MAISPRLKEEDIGLRFRLINVRSVVRHPLWSGSLICHGGAGFFPKQKTPRQIFYRHLKAKEAMNIIVTSQRNLARI
jgi:hypothetical protein